MLSLLFFVFGIIFIEFIVPIIEELAILIVAKFESKKADYSIIVSKAAVEISKMEEEPEVASNVIGFQIPNENYEYEEDDDEE